MLLANLEYSWKTVRNIWLSGFWGSGYTWFYNQEIKIDELHNSVGVGIKIQFEEFPLIFYLAKALEKGYNPIVILRLDRMF